MEMLPRVLVAILDRSADQSLDSTDANANEGHSKEHEQKLVASCGDGTHIVTNPADNGSYDRRDSGENSCQCAHRIAHICELSPFLLDSNNVHLCNHSFNKASNG